MPNCTGLHGVFLTTMGADETQIEASFRAALGIAKEQKSASLQKRAEATYAEVTPLSSLVAKEILR